MTPPASPESAPSARFLPLLLVLFFGSGCAALIYEVVWFQLLQLVIGSSALSLAVLLGTFMGGMCLGSLALGRVVSARAHPLRVYAVLEGGIALTALIVLVAVPVVGRAYLALVGHGFSGLLLRGAVCALVLLPPTVLMGATLPAIARWVESTPRGVAWLGWFYGGNTIGAVAGCLLAGFYLLRVHDTTAVAAALAARAPQLGPGPRCLNRGDPPPFLTFRSPHRCGGRSRREGCLPKLFQACASCAPPSCWAHCCRRAACLRRSACRPSSPPHR